MSTAAAIAEMLAAWERIERAARAQFPNASEETIYQLCAGAMRAALTPR